MNIEKIYSLLYYISFAFFQTKKL